MPRRLSMMITLVMLALFVSGASAAAGDLDPTFSGDGKQVLGLGFGDSRASGTALQSDGKIVIAGNAQSGSAQQFVVVRYNADGTRDLSFGTGGAAFTSFEFGPFNGANAVAIQADGKIVAAGFTSDNSQFRFAVARFNTNGTLDTTFDGDGRVTTSFGGTIDIAQGVAIQADGKIVAVGRTFGGLSLFAVARYNTDGSLDASFSGDGLETTGTFIPNQSGGSEATSVVIQPDGKIVAVGNISDLAVQIAAARYNNDGSLDTSFGGDGKIFTGHGGSGIGTFASGNCVALQSDGKIVIGGHGGNNPEMVVVRLNTDGSDDLKVRTTIFAGGSNIGRSVVVQPDGRIVLGGSASTSNGGGAEDFAAVRFNSDLTLDLTFSGDGKVRTDFTSTGDIPSAMLLKPNGKLILAGSVFDGRYRIGLVGYESDGTLSTELDSDGELIDAVGAGISTVNDVAVQADGKIVTAGTIRDTTLDFAIIRHNADGTLDTTFGGGDGIVTADFANGDDVATSLVIQPDGKIVAAGGDGFSMCFARLNADGSFDTSFDGDGRSRLGFFSFFLPQGVKDIVLEPDGKLVVAAFNKQGDFNPFDIRIFRVGTTGAQDGASITTDIQPGDDMARAITRQSDGKILIVSNGVEDTNQDFAVIRYNTDLTLDTTFSGDGFAFIDFGPGDDLANGIGVQPDGKIVVVGSASNGANTDLGVARLNANGSLDSTFSGDGRATSAPSLVNDVANAVRIQPADGKIVVGGTAATGPAADFAVVRFNTDGTPDSSWGVGGTTVTEMGGGDNLFSITLQSDGKVVAGGESNGNFALARYQGTPVPTSITGRVMFLNTAFPAPMVTPSPDPVAGVTVSATGSVNVSAISNASGDYVLSGFGAGPYTVTPSRPSENFMAPNGINSADAALVAKHVVGSITLDPIQQQAASVGGPLPISSYDAALIARWVVGILPPTPSNQTGIWLFTPAVTMPDVTVNGIQNYQALLKGDVTGDWTPAGMRPAAGRTDTRSAATISAPGLKAASGTEVIVPLTIADLRGRSFSSYQFDIEFDPAVLSPLSVDGVNSISEGLSVVSNSPYRDVFKIAAYGAVPAGGDGILIYVRFKVVGKGGSRSPIDISRTLIGEGDIGVNTANGSVSVVQRSVSGVRVW